MSSDADPGRHPPTTGGAAPADLASTEGELLAAARQYVDDYSGPREGYAERVMAHIAPGMTGFGSGSDEAVRSREDYEWLIRRDREMVESLRYRSLDLTPLVLSESIGVVYGSSEVELSIGDGKVIPLVLRVSAVYVSLDGRWKMIHGHFSRPDPEQPEGESLPLDALWARNQQLERLVAERTADLRAAQAQLVHTEKMASLGALTAGIAHEIKNPLNFVTNFAALGVELADELGEAEGDDRAEILADLRDNAARIAEHGARADAIVTSMMQHAEGGTGNRQPVDLNGLVRKYAEHARHALLARDADADVDLALRLGDDVGTVEVAPQEIGRVIVALLSNAFDAVRERAGAGRVTVTTARTAGGAEIRVEDDGPGIAPDALGRVFEPFYTTKPTGQGHTGLGLSLAHDAVVQGHGGTLTAESAGDRGATFILVLPA